MTVDKEDFVQEVHLESIGPIEHTNTPTRLCRGPWHNRSGKGTLLPESEFDISNRKGSLHQLQKTCRKCLNQNRDAHTKFRNGGSRVESVVNNGVVETKPVLYHGPELPTWRVTIVKATEVLVNAKDFLDAASAAGDGEIVKVERLT